MRTIWTFHTAGQLAFGRNAIEELGQRAAAVGARRVLVVTDPPLAEAGVLDRVTKILASTSLSTRVFEGGQPEPSVSAVDAGVEMGREFRPDAVLGLGGGSNMDVSKAVATVLTHGGKCQDYAGEELIPGPLLPLICVPTTAGTGSEVSAAAVLKDTETKTKFGILSNLLRPRVAVVDPTLTVSCPAHVTADSGIDALTHAVEAYTAVDNETFPLPEGERTVYQGRHPLVDVLAERAISLIGSNLRRAVTDGRDLEAREGMALASTLAGMAFSNSGVAVVHALEIALGPVAKLSHGRGNGLLLPYVMRFNKPARISRMARVAALLGEDDVDRMEVGEAADRAITAVERLKADIGIPERLRDVGVGEEHLPQMAEKAFTLVRILRVNPRTVTEDDLLGILRAAW